jgi:hypothetical protein
MGRVVLSGIEITDSTNAVSLIEIEGTDRVAMIMTGRMIIANDLKILELPLDCREGAARLQTIASFGLPPAPIMAVAHEATNAPMSESQRMCVNG